MKAKRRKGSIELTLSDGEAAAFLSWLSFQQTARYPVVNCVGNCLRSVYPLSPNNEVLTEDLSGNPNKSPPTQ